MQTFDIIIIGGGIIGLSTAMHLLEKYPNIRLALLEKEKKVAQHQTGHNSGVIHSGIYYKPGSMKAKTCVSGVKQLLHFCDTHHIPYHLCGKVIVATKQEELKRLETLYQRGKFNGLEDIRLIDHKELNHIEPYAAGIKAIHIPTTGIVDYVQVAKTMVKQVQSMGGHCFFSHKVTNIEQKGKELIITTSLGQFSTTGLVNCAGLYSDHVASFISKPKERIIPFRGEYTHLS